jgi:methylated-DNA-[protein]-cysteine S-methyltransferase
VTTSRRRCTVDSPVGLLGLEASDTGLTTLHLDAPPDFAPRDSASDKLLEAATGQLREYFEGSRRRFDLPLDQQGSDFQRSVWNVLCSIPYGATVTYGEIARRVGMPRGAQAVGLACGSNPIAIVVPCHRVLGADGRLTGYAGGVTRKSELLAWEQRDSLLF